MLLYVPIAYSFYLLLSGIAFSGYAAVCLCIQVLRDMWNVSSLGYYK